MKLKLPLLLPFKKEKKEKPKKAGKQAPRRRTRPAPEIPESLEESSYTIMSGIVKINTKPQIIFVGSSKGGAGKSFITAGLSIVTAALSRHKVYAIDFDIDTRTLSNILPPLRFYDILEKELRKRGTDYLNVGDILIMGTVRRGLLIPRIRSSTHACDGRVVDYDISFIPAFDKLKERWQAKQLNLINDSDVLSAVDELIKWMKLKKAKGAVFFIDSKPKGIQGINVEPIYSRLADRADLFLYIVEPSTMNLNMITDTYGSLLDKMVIVLNRLTPGVMDRAITFIHDALEIKIPVFIIPEVPAEGEMVRKEYTVPVARDLVRYKTSRYILSLAYFLNLLDDDLVATYTCNRVIKQILGKLAEIYANLINH